MLFELLSCHGACRYADFCIRHKLHTDMPTLRAALELSRKVLIPRIGPKVGLSKGRVSQTLLDDEMMPSAPLRAFSYTQAGGVKSCGNDQQINPVFKCPDGYRGGWQFDDSGAQINPSALEALRDAEDDLEGTEKPRDFGYQEWQVC